MADLGMWRPAAPDGQRLVAAAPMIGNWVPRLGRLQFLAQVPFVLYMASWPLSLVLRITIAVISYVAVIAVLLRSKRSDWKDFATFCGQLGVDALPAAPAVVAGYVAELADPPDDRSPARVSTITRRLAAIGEGHKVSGHPNPASR